jgi:hypothetical protein
MFPLSELMRFTPWSCSKEGQCFEPAVARGNSEEMDSALAIR